MLFVLPVLYLCSRSQHKATLSPLLPWCPVCILLCQCSTPAAVWERTQRWQLSVLICIPGTPLDTEAPSSMPCSEDDIETDLCYAEDDETSQKQRGCCCCCSCCQVRNNHTVNVHCTLKTWTNQWWWNQELQHAKRIKVRPPSRIMTEATAVSSTWRTGVMEDLH